MRAITLISLCLLSCFMLSSVFAQSAMDDATRRAQNMPAFLTWVNANGFPSVKLTWNVERQLLVASANIGADENLMTVPNRIILSVDKVAASPMKDCLAPASGLQPSECVVLYFAVQSHQANSFWKPYIDVLPRDMSHLPAFWNDAELDQLQAFKPEFLKNRQQQLEMIQESFQRVSAFLASRPDIFGQNAVLPLATWQWAVLIFQTRSYKYPNSETSCLVPVNDMLNHANGWTRDEIFKFSQNWVEQTNDLEVKLGKPIEQGHVVESVFSSTLNTGLFLFRYGFVPSGGLYAADWVDTQAPVIYATDKYKEQKERIISHLRMWPGQNPLNIFLVQSGVPASTLAALRLSEMTDSQFVDLVEKNVAIDSLMNNIITLDNEWACYIRINKVVESLLAQFPTTAEQDHEIIKSIETGALKATKNALNALAYRKYFKDILINARANVMQRWMSLLTWQPNQEQQQALNARP